MTLRRVLVGRGVISPRAFVTTRNPESLDLDSLYLVFKDRLLWNLLTLAAPFRRVKFR